MPGLQREQSRRYSVREALMLLCDEAESFGMEARCCNWHPRVQTSRTGAMCTCQPWTVSYSTSYSMAQCLVSPFLWYHFITFATLSFGSHSISSAQAQNNSPSSKQHVHSYSGHFQLLLIEKKCRVDSLARATAA